MDRLVGRNPVMEALRAGRPINKIMIAQSALPASLQELLSLAKKQEVLVQYVERRQLDLLTGGEVHQGVVALAAAKEYSDWEEILENILAKRETPLFLLLDSLEDPRNLGAILRTADAVGVHCVIIPKHRAVPLTSGVAKASAGAIEYVPVSKVTNLVQTMKKLKEKGFWIAGADQEGKKDYYEQDLLGPFAVVLGGEGKGLGRLIRANCDYLLRIPMAGRINSLNVSAAASVLLYEIIRQRRETARK